MKRIKGIVLAAGLSSRMGDFKPLLPYGGKKVITSLIEEILGSNIDELLVVIGYNRELLTKELSVYDCKLIYNPEYELGMHTSVISGVKSLSEPYDAHMQFLGDQPEITTSLINYLIASWNNTSKGIVIPSYSGKGGHPVIISKKYVEQVKNIGPVEGLRAVMRACAADIDYIPVDKDTVLFDIDTPEDYKRLLERKGAKK